ncbi:GNAT family N-acetyltransferase [Oceanithermus profundus]
MKLVPLQTGDLDAVFALWARAHGVAAERMRQRHEIMERHFGYPGFEGFGAYLGGGITGFVYGFTGLPGQWWYERVRALMPPEMAREWLEDHFEFTELAVDPAHWGRGLGGRLHDEILAGRHEPRALLTVNADNARARGFYERRGWVPLLEDVRLVEAGPLLWVMGKRLA